MIYIPFYIIFTFVIQSDETLRCYSCQGEKRCGRMFSLDSMEKKIVQGNDLYDSCSITMDANGSMNRDIRPAHTCRSSSYQFCCNEDLCNDLSSLPLPALTTRSCAVGFCTIDDQQCNDSMVYLSSATESCVTIQRGNSIHKSYRMGCSSNLENGSISEELFCCNSPACNRQNRPSDLAIRCYTCDSRITGLEGCSILDISSPHIFNSGSSSRSESCAMIVGLAGKDPITGSDYPAFTIRTFIDNCVNQSLGNITYGGAVFQGRIDCCSTSLCITNITRDHRLSRLKLIVFLTIVCLGIIFIFVGISLSIYRFRLKRRRATCDGTTVLFLPAN